MQKIPSDRENWALSFDGSTDDQINCKDAHLIEPHYPEDSLLSCTTIKISIMKELNYSRFVFHPVMIDKLPLGRW